MRRLILPSILLLMLIPTARTRAQSPATIPPEVTTTWSYLIGDWDVEGRVGSRPVTGTATFEWAEGKHCYLGRQTWEIGDDGRTIQLVLIGGWDAAGGETVERGFSTFGDTATVRYRSADETGDVLKGRVDAVNGPDARWSGTIKIERRSADEFQLATTRGGEVVHSLRYSKRNVER